MARPRVKAGHEHEPYGGDEVDVRHAYGIKWSGPKRFLDQARGALNVLRKQFQELPDGEIVWRPYDAWLWGENDLAPPSILNEQALWFARVPLIHFWSVEFHYPDRVMRQFGRKQIVPPPAPEPWEVHEKEMKNEHKFDSGRTKPDWPTIHARSIQVTYFPLFQIHRILKWDTTLVFGMSLFAATGTPV